MVTPRSTSSYYCYIVRIVPGGPVGRDELMARLAGKGIETTVMFRPVDSQPYFKDYRGAPCPNAAAVGDETLCLPLHTAMATGDVKYIVAAMRGAAD